MAQINLFNNKGEFTGTALFDEEHLDNVIKYKWYMSAGYACNTEVGKMHRFIWKLAGNDFLENHVIDHKNFDRLDNRLSINLRQINASVSSRHQEKKKDCSSSYIGAHFNQKAKKWQAQIRVKGIGNVYLGLHETEILAAMYYKAAAEFIHEGDYQIENNLPLVELSADIKDKLSGKIAARRIPQYYKERNGTLTARYSLYGNWVTLKACCKTKEEAIEISKAKAIEVEANRLETLLAKVKYVDEKTALIPWEIHELRLKVDHQFVIPLLKYKQQSWNRNGYPTFSDNVTSYSVHQWIIQQLDTCVPKKSVIDHINGDIFDASSFNLRVCSISENNKNRDQHRGNANGVSHRGGQYFVSVTKKGRKKQWGPFKHNIDADQKYANEK